MSSNPVLQAACEAVHELLPDSLAFAVVIWKPGHEGDPAASAYGVHPEFLHQAPDALRTAARIVEQLT